MLLYKKVIKKIKLTKKRLTFLWLESKVDYLQQIAGKSQILPSTLLPQASIHF